MEWLLLSHSEGILLRSRKWVEVIFFQIGIIKYFGLILCMQIVRKIVRVCVIYEDISVECNVHLEILITKLADCMHQELLWASRTPVRPDLLHCFFLIFGQISFSPMMDSAWILLLFDDYSINVEDLFVSQFRIQLDVFGEMRVNKVLKKVHWNAFSWTNLDETNF